MKIVHPVAVVLAAGAMTFGTLSLVAAPVSALPCNTCGGGVGGGSGQVGTQALPRMAQYYVSWSSFGTVSCSTTGDQQLCGLSPDALPAHDDIWLSDLGPTSAGWIAVTLHTAPGVTWYKEIKAFDASGRTLGVISTQDSNHGDVTMRLPASNVASLVFTKAGFLGIHTGVYDLRNISAKSGRSVRFDWTVD